MAYLDALQADRAFTAPAADAVFERREWEVVALARRDGLASLREPGWLDRVFARLFGGAVNPRLADPRLEALRQLAVLAWHYSYAVPVSAIKAFKAAGFSIDQLEILLASIAAGRTSYGRSSRA